MGLIKKLNQSFPFFTLQEELQKLLEPVFPFYEGLSKNYKTLLGSAKNPAEVVITYSKTLLPAFFAENFLVELEKKRDLFYKFHFQLESAVEKADGVLAADSSLFKNFKNLNQAWIFLIQNHLELYKYKKLTLPWVEFSGFMLQVDQILEQQRLFFQHLDLTCGLALTFLPDPSSENWQLKTLELEFFENPPSEMENEQMAEKDQNHDAPPTKKTNKSLLEGDWKKKSSFLDFTHWICDFISFLADEKEEQQPISLLFCEFEEKWGALFAIQKKLGVLFEKLIPILLATKKDPKALSYFVGEYMLLSANKKKIPKKDLVSYQKQLHKILEAWPKDWSLENAELSFFKPTDFFSDWKKKFTPSPFSDPNKKSEPLPKDLPKEDQKEPLTKKLDLSRKEHIGFLTER